MFVVMQRKKKGYGNPPPPAVPIGEFILHRLEKITPKCIITKHGSWGTTERHNKKNFYYREFATEEEANRFISEAEGETDVAGWRAAYEQAKEDMRDAGNVYSLALKQAGEIAWKELTDE